jgi:hypothetical protein
MGKKRTDRQDVLPGTLHMLILNLRARYYRLTRAGRRQLGDAESSFARLIEAITRVMRPA